MSLNYNGNNIESVTYNGNVVEKVTYNGTVVWELLKSISISGTSTVGYSLSASITPSTAKVTYQWYRGDNVISGATSGIYKVTSSDVGYQIHCKASTSTKTVDSNWTNVVVQASYTWTDSVSSQEWNSYPTLPVYKEYSIGTNMRITNISIECSKAHVDGEYGYALIEAYYNGEWHRLAKGEAGFSAMGASWTGDLTVEKIRVGAEGQVCSYYHLVSCSIVGLWTYHDSYLQTCTFTGGRGTGWTSQSLSLTNIMPAKLHVVGDLWQYDWSANPYYKICFNNDQTNIVATNQKYAGAGECAKFDDTFNFYLGSVPTTINGIFDSRNNGYTFYVYIDGYYTKY